MRDGRLLLHARISFTLANEIFSYSFFSARSNNNKIVPSGAAAKDE